MIMENVILKLDDISYRYKDAKIDEYVFKDINYDFELGKTYAIKGKSGSGKTTLLSLISGLETNYEGSITYNGENLKSIDLDKYRNTYIGIVFQSYNLLPHLNAMENIILSMEISGIECENKKEKALELMESVGLSKSLATRRVLKLSGGEQQRIAIARSLSYNPNIIIADEPTGNLDKETEDEILKIFSDLAHKENKCVIIVTHSKNVCDNVDFVYDLKKDKEKSKAEKIKSKKKQEEKNKNKSEKKPKNNQNSIKKYKKKGSND
jgi:putative ABC transport system ATP-binding protein